jgi:hypothetical protein
MTPATSLSAADWARLGHESLRDHLVAQAAVAHQRYAPFTPANLDAFLRDPACLRYPTRLVFEFGEMAQHQFAQPDRDWRNPQSDDRILYLRPCLRDRPDHTLLAVAYMVPVLNYGDVATDEHCRCYGATLLGLVEEEFYRQICAMADDAGCLG